MVLQRSPTSQNVLVVEDEMLLRMLAVDMVEDAGYTSVEAVDAYEAFAILKSRSDIALLFTDIQMPGSMDGLQLAHSVSAHWPTIKIIIVSGQLKLSGSDMPVDSRFFAKPLESRICELVEYHLEDVTIRGAWTGPAALHLSPHALAPVAELPVLEIVSAIHILADLTLGLGKMVHDYLQQPIRRPLRDYERSLVT
jgi:CheY-like chemotaxis protein